MGFRVPVTSAWMALGFGPATAVFDSLPAVKGDDRAHAVLPGGDALVLEGPGGARAGYLDLLQNWTAFTEATEPR